MKKTILSLCLAMLLGGVYAQNPPSLFGSFWDNGSKEYSGSFDLNSKGVGEYETLPGVSGIVQGVTTFDHVDCRYFSSTDKGIAVIDAIDGSFMEFIVPSVPLKNLEFSESDNRIYGSYWTGSKEKYGYIDLATKQFTELSTLDRHDAFLQGSTAFDQAGKRHFIASIDGILVIDAATGQISSVIQDAILKGIEYDPASGYLYGRYWDGSKEIFAKVNIATKQVTDVKTLVGHDAYSLGENTLDPDLGKYYCVSHPAGILEIDIATGDILDVIPNPKRLKGLEHTGCAPAVAPPDPSDDDNTPNDDDDQEEEDPNDDGEDPSDDDDQDDGGDDDDEVFPTSAPATAANVYPNPCNGILHMSMPDGYEACSYKIMNSWGKEILSGEINAETPPAMQLQIPAGTYYLMISYPDGKRESKTLVKK